MSKKIAHLGTVTLDTKLATSKQLNADEIFTNGEDVAEMFNREQTYRELTSRVKLEPEDNYILYSDDGKVVSANLSGVTNGTGLFVGAKIDKVSQKTIDDWKMGKIQNASHLFDNSKITEFEGSFPDATTVQYAFAACPNLTKVKINFPKIKSLSSTFQNCTSLRSFEGNLDNIIEANNGFWYTALESFDIPLPNMTTPHWMFCGAGKLKSFSSYMPLVTNAQAMFSACSSLTSFTSKIKRDEDEFSSLSNGTDMFLFCKLDATSVKNILTQIQPFEDGSSHILTLGISAEAVPTLNEITGNTLPLSSVDTDISYKGWTLKVAVNDLPFNYRAVAYLESTGTQWIDSRYIPNNETGLYTKHLYLNNGNTRPCGTIGTNKLYAISVNASTGLAYGFGETYHKDEYKELYNILQEGYVNYFFNGMRLTQLNINDELFLGWHPDNIIFDGNSTIFLFTLNAGNGTVQNIFVGRIYSIKISQGSEIVRDFVPCVDNVGNPCMYDTVTKETFRNEGSGQFIVPAETTTYSLRQPQAAYAQLTKHGICRLYHVPEGYEGSEEDYAQEFGFKQLVENERPEEIEEGYYWHPRWKETETEVILYWTKEIEEEMMNV